MLRNIFEFYIFKNGRERAPRAQWRNSQNFRVSCYHALTRAFVKIRRARVLHDARARARDHILNYVIISTKLKINHERLNHCERMQLRNHSNKIKMPSFSVSFASLMWKTCRKTFCGYFHLWKFSCSNSFQKHFK